MPRDNIQALDDVIVPDVQVRTTPDNPLAEMGVTGLKRSAGIVDEEFLPALRGRKAIKVFKEMTDNDPIVGSLMFTIDKLLRQVEYRVEAADNTPDSRKASEFLEECMQDMSHTWDDMISEILTMLAYGWSYMEVTYKKRIGPWEKDARHKSKHTDGAFGWRKISIRSQETMQRWVFDDNGGIKGMVQLAPPHWGSVYIPIERSLLFRTVQAKNNPEGKSLLRNAYRPWFFKKRLEEFEAIGVERDLAGMPVAKIPAKYFTAGPGSPESKMMQAFKKLVTNVRRDEHEGLVLPMEYDSDTKQPLYEFELMSAGGSRQFDTTGIINRYEQRILMTVLADFIMVGHEGSGSYAMHVDKTGIFRAALNSIAQNIADVFNRHAIPRLFELNGWKLEELPKIVPNNVENPDLVQLANFMQSMGGLGMEWFPDAELEKYLRSAARLPALPDEIMELRQQQSQQKAAMSFAQQQMDFLGIKQKAEMTAQGFSPEQAEMASQQQTPEMTANEETARYKGHAMAQQDPDVARAQQEEQEQQVAQGGDPQQAIQQKAGEADIDEQRAQADHKRNLELKDREDKTKEREARLKNVMDRRAANKPKGKK